MRSFITWDIERIHHYRFKMRDNKSTVLLLPQPSHVNMLGLQLEADEHVLKHHLAVLSLSGLFQKTFHLILINTPTILINRHSVYNQP